MLIYNPDARSTRPAARPRPGGITGRDRYILGESLVRYIVSEASKPDAEQAWSDLQDAKAIFLGHFGADSLAFYASRYPGVPIDMTDAKAPRQPLSK